VHQDVREYQDIIRQKDTWAEKVFLIYYFKNLPGQSADGLTRHSNIAKLPVESAEIRHILI
jgi:hypothetical protein